MSIALTDIIDSVNQEVENHLLRGTFGAEGDGTTYIWHAAPTGRFLVNDETFLVTLDGEPTSAYTMNWQSGDIVMTSPPDDEAELLVSFNSVYWSDDEVEAAVATAAEMLFPNFYVTTVEEVQGESDKYEYTLSTPFVEAILQVDHSSNGDEPWTTYAGNRYESHRSGEDLYLKFYTSPGDEEMKVHVVSRPYVTDSDTIEVPDRAFAPMVSYAAYYLLSQKQARRVRSDVAVNTLGVGTLSPRQMNDAANALYLRFQMQLQFMKMRPWQGR